MTAPGAPVTLADDFATLTVTAPTPSRTTILLDATAISPGVTARVELTAAGAFDLARLLRSASVRATAERTQLLGDPTDLTDPQE